MRRVAAVISMALSLIAALGFAAAPANATSDLGCRTAPGGPLDPDLWIYVTKWCGNPAVRGQLQIKVQLKVKNIGSRPLDISRSRIRLIVRTLNRSKWSPPKIGKATTDRPLRTHYRGARVWAIPANVDRVYDEIPSQPGVATFATHWGGTSLAAYHTFFPKDHERGALVFYRPRGRHQKEVLEGVVGLGYLTTGGTLRLVCPPDHWGPRTLEGTF